MRYEYISPSPVLQDYIDYYLLIESNAGEEKYPVTVYPSPQAEMVFSYGDYSYEQVGSSEKEKSNSFAISGFFTNTAIYTNENALGVIMIGFKPWGIQSFLPFSISEVTNINLSMEDAYPGRTKELESKLKSAGNTGERITVIENFLLRLLRPFKTENLIKECVLAIQKNNGQISVRDLSRNFCLSEKQFKRRFQNAVGINPKLFARLVRFQFILQCMDKSKIGLLDKAIETGFYDESHFIKEFKEFTGLTPSAYLHEKTRTSLGQFTDEQFKKSFFYNTIYR